MEDNFDDLSFLFNEPDHNTVALSTGDIVSLQDDRQYHLYKLLSIDQRYGTYHMLSYTPSDHLPGVEAVVQLPVLVYHVPLSKQAFAGAVLLGNTPVKADELIGYHEYLRQTQEPELYIPLANQYYKDAYQLTNEQKFQEAIDEYSKAIDLFPLFYEAIDNRAFCKMDLGWWEEAIEDFQLSLNQNPDSFLAIFSIGECYLRAGELHNAREYFETARQIDPNHPALQKFLGEIEERLNR